MSTAQSSWPALCRMAAITAYLIFPSWDDLLLTLAFAKPRPDAAHRATESETKP